MSIIIFYGGQDLKISLIGLSEAKNRAKNIKNSLTEVEKSIKIKNLNISTKIDRINFTTDDKIQIIDYKTGIVPADTYIKKDLSLN